MSTISTSSKALWYDAALQVRCWETWHLEQEQGLGSRALHDVHDDHDDHDERPQQEQGLASRAVQACSPAVASHSRRGRAQKIRVLSACGVGPGGWSKHNPQSHWCSSRAFYGSDTPKLKRILRFHCSLYCLWPNLSSQHTICMYGGKLCLSLNSFSCSKALLPSNCQIDLIRQRWCNIVFDLFNFHKILSVGTQEVSNCFSTPHPFH